MHSNFLSRRGSFVLFSVLLLLLGALLGCSSERASSPLASEAVRDRFPEQVHQVLDVGPGFLATPEGFASRPRQATPGAFHPAGEPIEAVLSTRAEDGLRFRSPSGFALTVRELGATGDAAREGSAVTYARPGGRSYWSAMANGGVEEWLLLEAEAVTSDAPVAAWEVEGASLRQQGEAVEVVDASGKARMSVTAPRAHAEGGRAVEARLVASGERLELWVQASGEAVLVDPVWLAAGSMKDVRGYHTATLLPSGQVLVAGGDGSGGLLASAELYDPATQTWALAKALKTARKYHTATQLPSGQVLVAGGANSGGYLASAELYDPAGRWEGVASMRTGRVHATATLLSNNQVLVAGGLSSTRCEASVEQYDPASSTWAFRKAMGQSRAHHTATLLPGDQVLVAGGLSAAGNEASVERYDPVSSTWTSAASMGTARAYHTATLLQNDLVLVAGGSGSDGARADAELYDPHSDQWMFRSAMQAARWQHTATQLPSGSVLVAGGWGNVGIRHDAELYDPAADQWTTVQMTSPRTGHTATRLKSNQVLLVGGVGTNGPLTQAELFDPVTQTFAPTAPMLHARTGHLATLQPDGRVLVAGGTDSGGPLESAELYDPVKKAWQEVRPLATPRSEPVGTSFPDGSVLAIGGVGAGGISLAGAELFELFDEGTLCDQATDCQSGFCAGGVCCDTACTSPCNACSVRLDVNLLPVGAKKPGTCEPVNGVTCNDGDACTQGDTCQAGACQGSPVVCTAPNDCQKPGTCDAATGQCGAAQPKDEGASCDDGNDCTEGESCRVGACEGTPVTCACPDCGRYACFGPSRSCKTRCDSVNDCSPGYVCDPDHDCVTPPSDERELDTGGCALAPSGPLAPSPWPPAALSLLTLAALGARRRGRCALAPTRQQPPDGGRRAGQEGPT